MVYQIILKLESSFPRRSVTADVMRAGAKSGTLSATTATESGELTEEDEDEDREEAEEEMTLTSTFNTMTYDHPRSLVTYIIWAIIHKGPAIRTLAYKEKPFFT
eukprot:Pompholyxophrys_sp_v1_NODE_392_length_618_cov_6.273535.p1 type:complete len:104 gc:universal NODE_392_length_618_cov_6.273535:498-187(-)